MNTLATLLLFALLQSSLSFLADEFELDKQITELFRRFDFTLDGMVQKTQEQTTVPQQKVQQEQKVQPEQTTQAEQKTQQHQEIKEQKEPQSLFGEIERTINKYTNEIDDMVVKIEEELGDSVLKDAEQIYKLGRPHFLDMRVNNESFMDKLGFNYDMIYELEKLRNTAISTWDHFVTTLIKKLDRKI